jgi:PadR family transcriptional regulator PadR
MERLTLGEFEEMLMLTIAVLDNNAYGVSIKDEMATRLNRSVSIGAMQTALRRLQKKGFLNSSFGEATNVRGGKRKRYFQITSLGREAIEQARDARNSLWNAIPSNSLQS